MEVYGLHSGNRDCSAGRFMNQHRKTKNRDVLYLSRFKPLVFVLCASQPRVVRSIRNAKQSLNMQEVAGGSTPPMPKTCKGLAREEVV